MGTNYKGFGGASRLSNQAIPSRINVAACIIVVLLGFVS